MIKNEINEKELKITLNNFENKLPVFLKFLKKSEYLLLFKKSKHFYTSKSHQTDKYLFRRKLFKPFI